MIDILLATYNGEKFISSQIESILCQTYTDWNLIIQDDGSTDNTVEILKNYQKRYPKKIHIFVNKKNTGSCVKNFLSLAKKVQSEYIMFCDQDDVWTPNKIELTLNEMLKLEKQSIIENEPILVHTDLTVVDEELNLLSDSLFKYQKMNFKKDKLNNLLVQNIVTGCTMMSNKNLIELFNLINDSDGIIMYDWYLGLLASAFGKIGFVNKPTILYRQHQGNQVGAKKNESLLFLISKLLSFRDFSNLMYDTYFQAEHFLKNYRKILNDNDIKIIQEYVNMKDGGRVQNLCKVIQYDFFKYGFFRKMAQIIKILCF